MPVAVAVPVPVVVWEFAWARQVAAEHDWCLIARDGTDACWQQRGVIELMGRCGSGTRSSLCCGSGQH